MGAEVEEEGGGVTEISPHADRSSATILMDRAMKIGL
jgi:hypothetical protein